MQSNVWVAVAAGLISAFFAMGFLTGRISGVLFTFIAALPLYFAGLMQGIHGGAIASVVGMTTVGTAQGMLFGQGLLGGLMFGFDAALPACIVAYLALRSARGADGGSVWYPGGYILSWLAVVFAVAFLGWAVTVAENGVLETMRQMLDEVFSVMWPDLPAEDRTGLATALAGVFPALAGVSWIGMAVASGVLAQKVLVRLKRNLRPISPLGVLELPNWLTWSVIGAAVIGLIGSGDLKYIGYNLTMVLTIPFMFLGMAVVHLFVFARALPYPRLALTVFYVCAAVFGWPIALLIGLGFTEQWIGLRRRFADLKDWE